MIVRSEAKTLPRCLASVRPWIDAWAIIDTGSNDGTQDVAREALRGLPGQIVDEPWTDFATARNQALGLARAFGASHALIIDADQVIVSTAKPPIPALDAELVLAQVTQDGVMHCWREFLVKLDSECRWYRPIHECIIGNKTHARIPDGLTIFARNDGSRRRDPEWREKEIALLQQALEVEPRDDYAALKLAGWYLSLGDIRQAALIDRLMESADPAIRETTSLWLDGMRGSKNAA